MACFAGWVGDAGAVVAGAVEVAGAVVLSAAQVRGARSPMNEIIRQATRR
ncbi:MAG: hypothetical protein ACYC9S_00030 [Leptospirales bacterium]